MPGTSGNISSICIYIVVIRLWYIHKALTGTVLIGVGDEIKSSTCVHTVCTPIHM